MNIAEVKYLDVANGPGIRTSMYVSGCPNNCKECFNKEAQAYDYGKPFTKELEDEIFGSINGGLTVLGGEPMALPNVATVAKFLKRVRDEKPETSIWVYSGFTLEELLSRTGENFESTKAVLDTADILVDGRFEIDKKDITLQFRGSSNQRIIDLKKTFSDENKSHEVIIWDKLRH